jgi:HAD superfamily hydrolase (TIGR01509 family)
MIKAIFWDFFGVINIDNEVNPDVAEFINSTKDKYRHAIMSASNVDLHPWLQHKGIDNYFELVQTTKAAGMSKTSTDFYKLAMDSLKIDANQIVFVDDIQSYLDVAKALGINTVQYDYSKKIIDQLGEYIEKVD